MNGECVLSTRLPKTSVAGLFVREAQPALVGRAVTNLNFR